MSGDSPYQHCGLPLLALGERKEAERFLEVPHALRDSASLEPNRQG